MATEIFSNLAQAYLSTPIVSTPAAGTVETWTGIVPFPTGPKFPVLAAGQQFTVAINTVNRGDRTPELVAVTANSTPGTWTVVRGAGGSTVKTHLAGDVASGAAFDAAGTPFATSTQFAAVPSGTSVPVAWVIRATSYTLLATDGGAVVTATGQSITLPVAPIAWFRYGVKSGGAFTVAVVGTVDGISGFTVGNNAEQDFVWDGAAWRAI